MNIFDRIAVAAAEPVAFFGAALLGCGEVLLHPGKLRKRDLLYYIDLCGVKSVPIILLICYLMGLILGFQGATQMRKFGAEIYVADMVGFSVLKELGPFMVAVICTGRAGSAFAAEIGTMRTDDEINALSTIGIMPERYLIAPKLLAMFIVMPLLTVFGDVAGLLGGFSVGITYMGLPAAAYIERSVEVLDILSFTSGILKSFVFALLITLCGCYQGFRSSPDAQGVGRSATGAVVLSIFAVVTADAVITVIYTLWGW